ncbi:MAG: tripartite tricarboxylate transporter permease [Anaerolineae bacterium]
MAESLLWSLLGAIGASLLGLIPALHIYNIAGFLLLLNSSGRLPLTSEAMAFLFLGMIAGYVMANTIPSIFLSAPDESMIFVVLPGQKYLLQRRGFEAVALTGLGSFGGLMVLVVITPFAHQILPGLRQILSPHLPWILWAVIAYMLLSEWPKGTGRAPTGWGRWWDGWRSLIAGLATFLLSGLLGFVLLYRSPIPTEVAYQNLLPAFVGLFAVPWIISNLLSRAVLPPQHIARTLDLPWRSLVHGVAAGALGGLFAAFFPVVTGGIGGFLAGHATAQRDDRTFLVAQGASKAVYYVGGYLLFFVPGLHLTRGGMAWMTSTQYTPYTPEHYYRATAAALLGGAVAFLLSLLLARTLISVLGLSTGPGKTQDINYRAISWGTLGLLMLVVGGLTGPAGLAVCAVASGIGLIPVLWGSRRMNAMGVLLLPIALNMIGVGDQIAAFLSLLD